MKIRIVEDESVHFVFFSFLLFLIFSFTLLEMTKRDLEPLRKVCAEKQEEFNSRMDADLVYIESTKSIVPVGNSDFVPLDDYK